MHHGARDDELVSFMTNFGERVYRPDISGVIAFIWGIADDVLRDLYVRGKYRNVILPMLVIRRLDKHWKRKQRGSCTTTDVG